MSEWKNRTTRLMRDDVKVSVMSYPSCFADAWQTIFAVHTEKNLAVCHIGKDWSDANARHNQLVNIAELMGYHVFSDEIDGKEKAPDATRKMNEMEAATK